MKNFKIYFVTACLISTTFLMNAHDSEIIDCELCHVNDITAEVISVPDMSEDQLKLLELRKLKMLEQAVEILEIALETDLITPKEVQDLIV